MHNQKDAYEKEKTINTIKGLKWALLKYLNGSSPLDFLGSGRVKKFGIGVRKKFEDYESGMGEMKSLRVYVDGTQKGKL